MINNQYLYLVSTIFRTSSPHLSSVSPVTLLRPDGLQAWYCFTQVANFLREKMNSLMKYHLRNRI